MTLLSQNSQDATCTVCTQCPEDNGLSVLSRCGLSDTWEQKQGVHPVATTAALWATSSCGRAHHTVRGAGTGRCPSDTSWLALLLSTLQPLLIRSWQAPAVMNRVANGPFCCVCHAVCCQLAGDGVHIMTGPIYVCGAEPGDILQVDILDLKPRKNPKTGKVCPKACAADPWAASLLRGWGKDGVVQAWGPRKICRCRGVNRSVTHCSPLLHASTCQIWASPPAPPKPSCAHL